VKRQNECAVATEVVTMECTICAISQTGAVGYGCYWYCSLPLEPLHDGAYLWLRRSHLQ